ncbi:MAG: type I DNA topoisomerase [Acidobacteria bacterium]|nr:type I DNA topoisomerase [Acidobacteriota bacterium]
MGGRILGVDIKHDFEPVYEVIPGKEKVIRELRTAAKSAGRILLAADPDREGEAICQHLKEILDGNKAEVFRVLFNEITPKAIRAAVENPGRINQHIVDAQQARRILDRRVGYQVSPRLWDKVRRGISAGRVQTVALRMIVEREREIQAFVPEEYWSIVAKLEAREPPQFNARLVKFKGKNAEVKTQAEADYILDVVKQSDFLVESVVTKEKKRNPVPPFITSKLQQDAARRLGVTVKKTMMLAQRLYEGIELGDEGRIGLITYMRTDSTRISDDAMQMVRSYVSDVYGAPYLPEKPVFYKSKKDAQDAHEAIRPTFVGRTPDDLKTYLSADELKLYRLIWTRFAASQMNPAVYDQTTVEISARDYLFRENGRVMKFDGFLKVYEESSDEQSGKPTGDEEDDIALPPLTVGERLRLLGITPRQHFTEPPPRFTEASLVKALEDKGIGRPSTYATILTTIQDREYVRKDQGKFKPTELGTVVTTMLVKHFEDIFDLQYTARMEEELDEVEEGKMTWVEALDEFYKKFEKDLKQASKNMENLKKQELPTEEVCEKCGSPMVIKWGQFGSFMACSGYPECKNTKEIAPEEPPKEGEASAEAEPEPCENCGKPMALKRGRFGQFLACTGYPECKTTRKLNAGTRTPKKPDVELDETCPKCGQAKLRLKEGRFGEFIACGNYPKCKYIKPKTVGVACPKPGCGGELSERRSKRGKVFYGCLKYPDCDFVVWNKPVPEPCPQCGAPFLLEKSTKREGLIRYCNEESCKYKIQVEEEKVS